jgi:hypothetical protein
VGDAVRKPHIRLFTYTKDPSGTAPAHFTAVATCQQTTNSSLQQSNLHFQQQVSAAFKTCMQTATSTGITVAPAAAAAMA